MPIVTMNLHLLLMKHHKIQHPQPNRVVLHQQMKERRPLQNVNVKAKAVLRLVSCNNFCAMGVVRVHKI